MARVHRHKQEHALFGPKESQKPDPRQFQLKQAKPELPPRTFSFNFVRSLLFVNLVSVVFSLAKRFEYTDRRKPALATKTDIGVLAPRTQKNFIAKNTTAAVKMRMLCCIIIVLRCFVLFVFHSCHNTMQRRRSPQTRQ